MKNWLKNSILSLLSTKNTKKIIILILCFEAIFFVAPRLVSEFEPAAILVGMLGDLTNSERTANNIASLKLNPILSEAAQLKADDMVKNGYFAHTSPTGVTPWHWLDIVGYKYNYAGENLAVNFTETADVTAAWMKSPTHRANIVKSAYTEMGSAIATGTYKGRESVFVVQVYGNPVAIEDTSTRLSVKEEENKAPKVAAAGQVLGTSTQKVSATSTPHTTIAENLSKINNEILQASFAQYDNSTKNKILLIILCLSIILSLANIFIKFNIKYENAVTNFLILISLIITVWLVNINFLERKVIATSLDYAQEQVDQK